LLKHASQSKQRSIVHSVLRLRKQVTKAMPMLLRITAPGAGTTIGAVTVYNCVTSELAKALL